METYLYTGIRIRFKVNCGNEQEAISLQKQINECFELTNGIGNIYNIYFEDKYLHYNIKDEILEKELIPFLEDFYAICYPKTDNPYCQKAIFFLKNNPYRDWNRFFEKGKVTECSYETLQDLVYINETWQPIDCIFLTLAFEGKIWFEVMNTHLNLYNYAIKNIFPYKIGNALKTIIKDFSQNTQE